MIWKRATSAGALSAALVSAIFSLLLNFLWPALAFIDRVGIVFLLCLALCYLVSIMGQAPKEDSSVSLAEVSFDTSKPFNISAVGVILILTALYATWW